MKTESVKTYHSDPTMNDNILQNRDIIHHILSFLINDGNSVVQFALSSKELYYRIMRHETYDPNLWKNLIHQRWKRTRRRPTIASDRRAGFDAFDDDRTLPLSFRDLYIEKRRFDAEARRQSKQMASVLQKALQLNETQKMVDVGNPHIGRAWDHNCWIFLLGNRVDCYDVLKATAGRYFGDASLSVEDRLQGFLAAICVQNFHFADCLSEWKRLSETVSAETQLRTHASQLKAAYLLEQQTLLVCEIQKTPLELLEDNDLRFLPNDFDDEDWLQVNYTSSRNFRATKFLDEIASVCKGRICGELERNASVNAKLKIVNDVLVNQYGFSGNIKDYYNYRNVLLDRVLESRTGMPLTLCLVYSCVCRRLDIAVQLTGLPGHIVLGFDTNERTNTTTYERSFIDVFHGCRFLSTDHCRIIVESYGIGWREDFLTPMSTNETLQRIFNNLRNCHEKAITRAKTPLFCSDLLFQQHTLEMIHRYPQEIASSLLERITQDLSIVLSPDLLRAYSLLSAKGLGTDPVVSATHARKILELSSYVGLSYHNYA